MGEGERLDRRIWILLDEWQTLQEVPKLHDILAEGRKYGAAVIAGNQNLKQLEDIYGKSKAATMLSLFNSKVIFRVPEPESAECAKTNSAGRFGSGPKRAFGSPPKASWMGSRCNRRAKPRQSFWHRKSFPCRH